MKTKGRPNYIGTWRKKLKLTHEDVARELGVHPITVRKWEQGPVRKLVRHAFDHAFRD